MELKEYILPLRKWWWLIVAATLVATLSSLIATSRQAPIYQTRTTIMVGRAIENPNPNGSDFWLMQQLAGTYADIAKRAPVQDATKAALGLTWLPDYTVRVVPNTQLVEISVVDTSPPRARAVAGELANQLILQTPMQSGSEMDQRQAFIKTQLDDLEVKIKDTQAEIAKKQTDLGNLFSARQIADTQTQIAGLQTKLATLQANYAALLSNTQQGAINTISVIEAAALPVSPIGPNKPATILLAAVIGFILAAGAAFLLEYLDDSLKNPDDVEKNLGLTTLGAIPVMAETATQGELAVIASSHSIASEAFRVLRTNLRFAGVDRPLKAVLITSPSPSEGKSLTAANLGAALAQAGERVILVDTDLHRPRLHRLFGLRNNRGVTSALLEEHPDLDGLLQETTVPGLQVLTSGPLPPNASELLGSARMRELLVALGSQADILLLDSPPATALADAAVLATQTDGVLLILDSGVTRREAARRAMEALRRVNARVVGAILNRLPTSGGGYYYYYYYHGRYHSSDDGKPGGGSAGGTPRWRELWERWSRRLPSRRQPVKDAR
ncbi:polysaccharide biosynthesis tyrosine autokinase [Candidatus Amarolinea aalborgensis]|uniref:polysaccharide biosynthesis tyrosine autokinase n=1 Tax=Candidatus Amarolinea aalborgensis TaxID=2249329 RepID=UPI003BF99260